MIGRLALGGTAAVLVGGIGWALWPTPPKSPAHPAPTHLTILAEADERTVYNQAFDGFEFGLGIPLVPGFSMMSTASPPDLVACIVATDGDADCQLTTDENGKPQSLFPDRRNGQFEFDLPVGSFGVILYDLDPPLPGRSIRNDIVDAFIVAPEGTDVAKLEFALRNMIEQLAPTQITVKFGKFEPRTLTTSPAERRRRSGPIPTFNINACKQGSCRLQQSVVQMDVS